MILKWQQRLFNLMGRKNIWKEMKLAKWVPDMEIGLFRWTDEVLIW